MPPYPIACRKNKIVIQERIYCIQHFNIGKIISLNFEIDRAVLSSMQVVPHL
jgi:hypothetical protein